MRTFFWSLAVVFAVQIAERMVSRDFAMGLAIGGFGIAILGLWEIGHNARRDKANAPDSEATP